MGVDQVKLPPFVLKAPDERQHRPVQQERRGGHANFRHDRETGMQDLDPMARFLRRRLGIARPFPGTRMRAGEPGNRRDDRADGFLAGEKVP